MPEQLDDSAHPLRLISPLGDDLVVSHVAGQEELGRLFEFHLDLLSLNSDIAFADIVGQRVTVVLELDEGERYFDGFVTFFQYTGGDERFAHYQATVRPWLWFLTRTSDCRIFQQQTVPDIVMSVFRDNGMSDFDDRLSGSYREWVYCTQYRETDFNFVSRLMEQEGIYYFWEHEEGKHTLVLADDLSAHDSFEGHSEVPYFPPTTGASIQQQDHLEYLAVAQAIQPGSYAIADYDFEKPKVQMFSRVANERDYDMPIAEPEIFDYPGEYKEISDGDICSEVRLKESQSAHERVQGGGPVRTLAPGYLFTLIDHPRDDQNREYLAVSVEHAMDAGQYISGQGGSGELYRCQAEVIPSEFTFLAARTTPKPVVQGCQTAIVVGPGGEEIYTDEYGRVKVQFHWDRYGEGDENSSCWIRVSHAWAGKGWGAIHIPRIGQEVIVSFLEGDPDRPIITGRVYNAEEMPPYGLEANKTQSGIKSRSTKEGTADNFNEIRMEDKKGSEELYIQAEKNETILVKNDKQENVGHDETIEIDHDRDEQVGNNETYAVGGNRTTTIAGNDSLTVSRGDQTTTIEIGDQSNTLDMGNQSDTVSMGNKSTNVDMGDVTCNAQMGKITYQAATAIEFKVGFSTLKIMPDKIELKSPVIDIDAELTADLQAGMFTTVRGGLHVDLESSWIRATADSFVHISGLMTSISGSATTTISGGLVRLNC